jgi:hypothetical protein
VALYLHYRRILARVMRDTSPYTDVALTPAQQSDVQDLELFTATPGARAVQLKLLKRQEVARSGAGGLQASGR